MYSDDEKLITIAFCSDNRYAPYTGIAIQSLCENFTKSLRIVIVEDNISDEHKRKIEYVVGQFPFATLQWISVDAQKIFSKSVLVRDITFSAYCRFLLPRFFPDEERMVYVDGDVVFLKDASGIISELSDNYVIAAAPEDFRNKFNTDLCRRLGISPEHKWFYSGCLVINCKKWNENDIFNKLLAAEKIHYNEIHFGDQDLLNIVFDNNYSPLSEIYSATNNEMTEDLHRRAVIRHFEGGVKPWKQHPLKTWAKRYKAKYKGLWEFWKVAIRSPFKDELFARYSVERWIMERFVLRGYINDWEKHLNNKF